VLSIKNRAVICLALTVSAVGAQEPSTLTLRQGWIGGVAFAPDGRTLASAGADHTIQLIDLANQAKSRILKGHKDRVSAVAFSPDGKMLASASYDHTVRLWDVASGETLAILTGHRGVVTSVAFTPDGKQLATGAIDATVMIWDVAARRSVQTLTGHTSWVNAVTFSSSGKLATGSSDNSVRLWDKKEQGWTLEHQFLFSEGEVRSLAFAPDGKTLAAGVRYGILKIVDVPGKAITHTLKAHAADIWAVAYAPDGKTLATGDGDWDQPGDVRLWNTALWKERKLLKTPGEVLSLAYSPDGQSLAAGCWDGSLRIWNHAALEQLAALRPVEFRLTFTNNVTANFTGRVFVVASRQPIKDGPLRQNWFKPEPFFAQDVRNWKPGTPLAFHPTYHFPHPWAKLPAGKYHFQAIMDLDRGGQNALTAAGNGFSKPLVVDLGEHTAGPIALTIDQVVPDKTFTDNERVKLVDIESRLLTVFHGTPVRLRAGVVLPKSYVQKPAQRYPVVYEVPGFGGDHHMAFAVASRQLPEVGVEMIHVVLDPSCRLGHHVFADSANNGPCGRALIEELIPVVEKNYRALGTPAARFVTGHSSGGWSSLWLQVTYPDFFGGVWATAPDPVDFRDFQTVNIYAASANVFRDDKGDDRPLARKAGKVVTHFKSLSDMEVVLSRGGQLFSFEAVFSPKGAAGQPLHLWDRATGLIDPAIAKAWQSYDIRMILEKNWSTLGPKLAGKLHIYMGAEDTYYLEGATDLLRKTLKGLGSDAVVEIFPGRDHGTLVDQKLRARMAREMADRYRKTAHEN
jgi:S-formylglutathione hydrolase FrmB